MKKDVDWKSFVAELLDKLILTQGELAERLGSAQQTVSNWKNGSRKPGRYAMRKFRLLDSWKKRLYGFQSPDDAGASIL